MLDAKQLKKTIIDPQINQELNTLGEEGATLVDEAKAIATRLRELGVPVQAYRVESELSDLDFPFLVKAGNGWKISDFGESSERQGSNLYSGDVVVGEPPVGQTFQLLGGGRENKKDGEIHIFYAGTGDPANLARTQVFDELEHLLDTTRDSASEIVFIDALGLIPEESVAAQFGATLKARYEQAFQLIESETTALERGYAPVTDEKYRSPFWEELWEYLCDRKVRSVLEKLSYTLWKEIVEFDKQDLLRESFRLMYYGWPSLAAKKMEQLSEGYHRLNCLKRNEDLTSQIDLLTKDRSRKFVIVMAKEIGHYGVLERYLSDYQVFSKIIGRRRFTSLVSVPGLEMVLDNIEVKISENERKVMFLQKCIKGFIQSRIEINSLRESANFLAGTAINRLEYGDIADILEELHDPNHIYMRASDQELGVDDQLIYLLVDRGIIPSESIENSR